MRDVYTLIASLIVATATFAVTAIVLAGAWIRARDRAVRLEGELDQHRRFGRIQNGLDAIALEVERIGELERYSAKQIAARLPDVPAIPTDRGLEPGQVITPH